MTGSLSRELNEISANRLGLELKTRVIHVYVPPSGEESFDIVVEYRPAYRVGSSGHYKPADWSDPKILRVFRQDTEQEIHECEFSRIGLFNDNFLEVKHLSLDLPSQQD